MDFEPRVGWIMSDIENDVCISRPFRDFFPICYVFIA